MTAATRASARARVSSRELYRVLDPSVALGSSSRESEEAARPGTGSSSLIFFTHGNGSYAWPILTSGLAFNMCGRRVVRSNSFSVKKKVCTQYSPLKLLLLLPFSHLIYFLS